MENYLNNYDNFDKTLVYDFKICNGGIGDCIKYFCYALQLCIKNDIKLYYLINNIPIEKYLKLKYEKMYIEKENIFEKENISETNKIYCLDIQNIKPNTYNIVYPQTFWYTFSYDNLTIPIEEIFDFVDEIKMNSKIMLLNKINNYISIHLRLGDVYLIPSYIQGMNDIRHFDEEKLFHFIENLDKDKNIVFFCDNNDYKLKIKNKYNHIIITNCNIGHTTLTLNDTSENQVLDTMTEFYLLTNSTEIYMGSESGFPIIASKFKNIPLHKIIY